MYLAGAAKSEITPDCIGVGLLGWGDADHRVKGIKRPIYARAVVLQSGVKKFVFVCVELCFVTEALREEVLNMLATHHSHLGIAPEDILLTATHTHNAPGGHSKYFLYNITIPGFQPQVFQTYVNGIVRAVVGAFQKLEPAELRVGTGFFSSDSKVAFNRSLKAWRRNPEANPGEEIDREMVLMRIDRPTGGPIACINWFPVHCTSIHRDYHYIHSDNKGVAADLFEKRVRFEGHEHFISIFAQGAAGDVTPNFVKYFLVRDKRGPFRDDEKSCEFNAKLQLELALRIYENAASSAPIAEEIVCLLERHDFSRVRVDSEFSMGDTEARTGPAAIGCNFMLGTDEGKGAPGFVVFLAECVATVRKYHQYLVIRLRGKKIPPPWKFDPIQGPKICFMESGRARIFGISRLADFFLPSWIHHVIRNIKRLARESVRERRPFTPRILPLHLVKIDGLVLVAVPAEFTTVSGKRLRQTVSEGLRTLGIKRVILCGYSNAYSGYVTTYEEYQVQAYEGASTHFGMWTLAAYQTLFKKMCVVFAQICDLKSRQ